MALVITHQIRPQAFKMPLAPNFPPTSLPAPSGLLSRQLLLYPCDIFRGFGGTLDFPVPLEN